MRSRAHDPAPITPGHQALVELGVGCDCSTLTRPCYDSTSWQLLLPKPKSLEHLRACSAHFVKGATMDGVWSAGSVREVRYRALMAADKCRRQCRCRRYAGGGSPDRCPIGGARSLRWHYYARDIVTGYIPRGICAGGGRLSGTVRLATAKTMFFERCWKGISPAQRTNTLSTLLHW